MGNDVGRISVLVASYNREDYIEEALLSVTTQLQDGDELLVVDDGSTDNTVKTLENYRDNPRLRLIVKEHTNAPDTRNRAIREARNPWILWLGSDDVLAPGIMALYRAYISRFPDVDVIYGNQQLFGHIPNPTKTKAVFKDYYRKNKLLVRDLFYRNVLPDTGVLVRKRVYENHGNFNPDFPRLHDYEFWVRTAPYIEFKHCKRIMCKWRWHHANLSAGSSKRDLKYDSMIVERILGLYSLNEIFPFYDKTEEKSALARCYFEIGRQYRRVSDYPKAVEYILKSIRLKPIRSAYYEILSIVSLFSDLLPEYVKTTIPANVLEEAKAILPRIEGKTFIEKYGIASLAKRLGNLDHAKAIFEKMADAMMGKKKYSDLLAGVYFHLGEIDVFQKNYPGAVTMFENCVRILPNHLKAAQYLKDIESETPLTV